MNALKLQSALVSCVKAKLPVLIKGAPGIGKSDIVTQVAKILGYHLIISHPVVASPIDFKGLPGIVDGKAEFMPFGDLRKLIEATEPTIFFFDDLGQAPPAVQAAAMQLLLLREINGVKISEHIVFMAATNRRQDRAGVAGILEPVKSRFGTIIELTTDIKSWIKWAEIFGMPVELIDFLRFRPDLLMTGEPTADITNHPCPRTWSFVGKLFMAGVRELEVLAGAVGEGAAGEFLGFVKAYEDLPDLDEIERSPLDAKVPTEAGTQYAVVRALIHRLDKTNGNNILVYLDRLPADFCILGLLEAGKKLPSVKETSAYVNLAIKHQAVMAA